MSIGSRKLAIKVGDIFIVLQGVVYGLLDIPDQVDYLNFRPSHWVLTNGWLNPIIAFNPRCQNYACAT